MKPMIIKLAWVYILKVQLNKFILFKDNENKIDQFHFSLDQKMLKKHFIQVVFFICHKTQDKVCHEDVPPPYNLPNLKCCFSYVVSSQKKVCRLLFGSFLCVYISSTEHKTIVCHREYSCSCFLPSLFFCLGQKSNLRSCFFSTVSVGISFHYQYLNHRNGIQSISIVLNS